MGSILPRAEKIRPPSVNRPKVAQPTTLPHSPSVACQPNRPATTGLRQSPPFIHDQRRTVKIGRIKVMHDMGVIP
jgi:hypothetical protein